METIRGRLTAWYATALAVTLLAFAGALFVAQRDAAVRVLDQRIRSTADLTAGILQEIVSTGGTAIRGVRGGQRTLAPAVAATLEVVPGFLIVTDSAGGVLFASPDARALTFEQFDELRRLAVMDTAPPATHTTRIDPDGPTVRWVSRSAADAGPDFGRVLAGADAAAANLGIDQVLAPLVLLLPVSVLVAWIVGAWIARRALAPVDRIITEVEEITDGRSLHRRLPQPRVKDEFGRLAETLNRMMARLEQSFVALRRFTADASHELKTPLTVLRAGVERAITSPAVPRETLEVLEETLQEVNRMTELVDALLTLARVDEGRAPLHLESTDLRLLVGEVEETGELLAENSGVAIHVELPPHPVSLEVDASRIRQLLINLVTNALKYTPRGGEVRIALADLPERVTLTVTDTGIGIAPGDLPHVFDRFYRADTARTRTGERPGAGLGLAICKWVAEAHGGTIEVHSRPGRGTTFAVRLPRPAATAAGGTVPA